MAGYLFLINCDNFKKKHIINEYKQKEKYKGKSDDDIAGLLAIEEIVQLGYYSTHLKSSKWNTPIEATLGDYLTMNENDNVYFFSKRKIYGIGKLKKIANIDCKFKNYSDIFNENTSINEKDILINIEDYENYKFLCTFEPYPAFFTDGVDMDEVLSFNPSAYKMLRAISKVTFIKIDDLENTSLKNFLIKKNYQHINNEQMHMKYSTKILDTIESKILKNPFNYKMNIYNLVENFRNDNIISHEMVIEDMILEFLKTNNDLMGKWDFITHQYIASPFKPIEYMDKMDIFGYRYIPNYPGAISKYIICEIKKNVATINDLYQLMKYVDWVAKEHAYGDYSMIEAYLIASDFDEKLDDEKTHNTIERAYTISLRPPKFGIWNNLKKIKYITIFNKLYNS